MCSTRNIRPAPPLGAHALPASGALRGRSPRPPKIRTTYLVIGGFMQSRTTSSRTSGARRAGTGPSGRKLRT